MSTPKKHRSHGHPFHFQINGLNGKKQTLTVWTKVVNAKKPVTLKLTAADVQRSMNMKGIGNTQTCSMAVCAQRQSDAFPHRVEGYIDWLYSRAYVVTKVNVKTGMPEECVVYRHHDDIAKVNDSKGGQSELLSDLVVNGDREIHLLPIAKTASGRSGKRNPSSTKKRPVKKSIPLRGANLRFAVAALGGIPQ